MVELAISKNSRDRVLLGDKLESWAENWLTRVAKDSDNSPIEYIPIGKDKNDLGAVHERIMEIQRLKNERQQEKGEL